MAQLELAEQQDVDVDRARPVARPAGRAAELALQALDGVEQLQRLQRGAHAQAGVEEAGLVGHLADGVGVVHRGGRAHLHARRGQRVDRALQLGAAVADVGAEAEQADPRGHARER